MPFSELKEILHNLTTLAKKNPMQAQSVLRQSPNLLYALLEAEYQQGMLTKAAPGMDILLNKKWDDCTMIQLCLFQQNHSKNSNIQRGVRLFSTMDSRISISPGSSMRGVSSLHLVRFQWIPHFRRSFHYGCPPQASFSLPACAVHSTIDRITILGLLQAAVWLGTPYRFPPLLAFVSHIQAGTSWVCYP